MTRKQWKLVINILWLGTILAALKLIFFDYTMDEEYQIMMAYRNLRGDHLFKEMWEPHQTSAFMCTGLMWLYKTITGTYTGVLVYLRVCTTLIQVGISIYVYQVLRMLLQKEYALLCGLIYFNIVPKIIQIPEFSNMQLWFFTLMVLPLIQYYMTAKEERDKKWYLLVAAGISMALEVLSYPSCLIIFPFFLGYIFVQSKERRWKDAILFAGTCAFCAIVWLALILRNVALEEFLRNVGYVLNFDLTHEINGATAGKGAGIVRNIVGGVGLSALSVLIAMPAIPILKRKVVDWNKDKSILILLAIIIFASECIQMYYWVIAKGGYETYQIHLLVIMLAAAVAWRFAGVQKKHMLAGIVGTVLSLVAVIYLSDLEMYYALPHGSFGVLLCVVVLVFAMQEKKVSEKWIYFLLVCLCLISIFGKGYTLRAGRNYNVVLDTEGIMKHGPAVGVMSDYMNTYIYNCNYEDFQMYVSEEDTVLIVTNTVFSESTTPYMVVGADVAHYSIVDPTAYDERLLTYWELYPEKQPDVIVVDCWYGSLLESTDSWIMNYIENEFGYTQVNDGRYVRFYRR